VAALKLSLAEIGTLIGLFMVPGLVLSIPAGTVGRYLSDRTVIAAGLFLLALGGSVAAVSNGFASASPWGRWRTAGRPAPFTGLCHSRRLPSIA
jgi:hypothetical protein